MEVTIFYCDFISQLLALRVFLVVMPTKNTRQPHFIMRQIIRILMRLPVLK